MDAITDQSLPVTPTTRIRRIPEKAAYDRGVIDAILDEALVCHLGIVVDGRPFVVPTLHARVEDVVYVHGSAASRTLEHLSQGAPVALTVTLVDGLVMARSAFESSINYRSVMLFGTATPVREPAEKLQVLEAFTEQLVPGRWADVRPATAKEVKATSILSIPIVEGSAKISTGPPDDPESDLSYPTWAGVIPLRTAAGEPVPDPRLPEHITFPDYLRTYEPSARTAGNAHEGGR